MSKFWDRFLGRGKDDTEKTLIEMLHTIPVFEDLSKRELAAIERILHEREYKPNETIFRENEPGMGMYIIESGKVTILIESSNLILSELEDGDFFGEVSLLDDSPRSATAVAKEQSKLFGFFQPDLFGLVGRNHQLGMKIILRLARLVSKRLRRANQQSLELQTELLKLKEAQNAREDRPC